MSMLSELKLWTKYQVTLEFLSPCIGGVPNSRNLIEGWLKTKNIAATDEELKALVEATAADLGGKVEEKASAMWTVFKTKDNRIYLEGRQVKAMFKESSNILRDMLVKAGGGKKNKGEDRNRFTNLKSRVAERLHVEEDEIFLSREDYLPTSDGSSERPIHVQTAQGPRTALKRTDFVLPGTRLCFTVKILNDGVVDEELLKVLLEFSGDNGLGADRSQGNGKFKTIELKVLP